MYNSKLYIYTFIFGLNYFVSTTSSYKKCSCTVNGEEFQDTCSILDETKCFTCAPLKCKVLDIK